MKTTNMLQMFELGETIGGYCNGAFGRDDYYDKTCVKITPKYAVFEYADGTASVLNFSHDTARWKDESPTSWKPTGEER